MKSLIWFIPSFCVFLGILLLSTVFSIPVQVEGVGYMDKIQHAFAYFVLISTILFGFSKINRLSFAIWWLLMLLVTVYGITLEWVQYFFFPNRYFEWMDALANSVGVITGSLAFRLFKHV